MNWKSSKIEKLYLWKLVRGKNDPLKQTIRSVKDWKSQINIALDTVQSPSTTSDREIQKLRSSWDKIVGPVLYTHTDPSKIKGHTLIITVEKSVYAQEISFFTDSILNEINKDRANFIQKIRCETGKIERKKESPNSITSPGKADNKLNDENPDYINQFLQSLEKMKER